MADLVIIGAGPVGSLLALTLAQRGLSVDVYERRPDMRRVDISAGRSINLAVSTRGLHALHQVGLDADVLREAVPMLGRMTREALHIWPRGSFMLIALPNLDGSFTCTLFLAFEGSPSFAEIQKPSDAQVFGKKYFPDAMPLIPDFADQLMSAPLGRMVTVRAWPWSRGSALVIGDAAHAIVPFFGQGMNAGFEDVTLLAAGLTGNWAADFAKFAADRKPDAEAIADLAIENFVEMRDKVADPDFLRLREVEHQLQSRIPGRYLTRYQLVTFTRVPYRLALRVGQIQQRILSGVVRGDYDLAAAQIFAERELPLELGADVP